jgi:2-oxoglutarate ferredoxin oxidoreductase subunit beta
MGEAAQNLSWIDSISLSKRKFDALSEDEQKGKFPVGILKNEDEPEYCELYDKVIEAAQTNSKVKL